MDEMSGEDRRAIYAAVATVVASDGRVQPTEWDFLERARERLGMSPAEADEVRVLVWGGRLRAQLPVEVSSRILMLELVTQAAEADGEIQPSERRFLNALSARLGLDLEGGPPTPLAEASEEVHSLLEALRSRTPVRAILGVRTTVLGLIFVNLWSLVGVLYFRWDAYFLLFTYWAETVVIGLFLALSIGYAQGEEQWLGESAPPLSRVFIAVLFLLFFAPLAALHCLGVVFLFGPGNVFQEVQAVSFGQAFHSSLTKPVLAAIVFMFLAHGYSFFADYLRRREYLRATADSLIRGVYGRVMVMTFSIFVCGLLFAIMPRQFSVLLVLLKTGLDISRHQRG